MWKTILVLAVAIDCCAQAPVASPPAAAGLVKGVGNFIHDVADLDQSVHFYKDVLGMDVPRPAGDWQTSEGVIRMYNAIGGKYRVANAQVPGVAMRIELAEFQGVDRKPVKRTLGVAGASLLLLTVVDLQPVIDRLAAAKWPLAAKLKEGCDGKAIAVADPDGFQIVVMQKAQAATAPAGKNFVNLRFGYTVSGDALLNGPFKALKLDGAPVAHTCRPIEEAILNDSKPTTVKLPDGFEILLVKGTKNDSAAIRPQDPGAAVLRLMVNDVDAAVLAMDQSGTKVVSAEGAIQTLTPGTTRAAILGAPDGLLIQVVK
ncbi:MAG: VOC family protein [Acidobacteriota bacterium]